MTDVFDAARQIKQRPATVADRVDKADPKPAPRPVARKNPTVSAKEALKGESVGSKGERSFGAPLGTEQERQRQNQSTDSNN